MADPQSFQQSINWLALIVGPFLGVFGAFTLARIVDASKNFKAKLVAANLSLLTLKNQTNEFILFRKAFLEDVSRNCYTGNEPLWALIRPSFIVFGEHKFDFKAIGFLLEKAGNGSVLDAIELVQMSHRDLIAINNLRTENAKIVQEKILEYQRLNMPINWTDAENHVGENLTALLSMVAVGMGLRADRNEKVYLDAFNNLREAFVKDLDSYYVYWLTKIFTFGQIKPRYQLVSMDIHKPEFEKKSLPAMPKVLAFEVAKIPV